MAKPMSLFPLFADLNDRAVLVIGAGEVAARKVALLLAAGARVAVTAARLGSDVAALVREKYPAMTVHVDDIGTSVGAHSGPGTIALFFVGNER